jgi:esterase/lipase superfamily enzyme
METIYFGTNRNPNTKNAPTEYGKNFSEEGLASLRFGCATVAGDDFDDITIETETEDLKKDEERKKKDGAGSELGSQKVFAKVRQSMADNNRDTIIFIHGYNVSFRDALKAAAELQRSLNNPDAKVNVVLFSWPSDGSMMPYVAYANDRQDAAASGPAFARSFLKLADFLRNATKKEMCSQPLHLLAHSMGNYVLRHALQEVVRQSPGRPPRLFDQVFLMAADEDDDAFEKDHKFKPLPRIAKRVNVYFNNGDLAMAVSDKTKGNPDRLGDDGPRLPRSIPGKVSLIDCTDCIDFNLEKLAQHSYYLNNETVRKDMLFVLKGDLSKTISGRDYDPETNRYRL